MVYYRLCLSLISTPLSEFATIAFPRRGKSLTRLAVAVAKSSACTSIGRSQSDLAVKQRQHPAVPLHALGIGAEQCGVWQSYCCIKLVGNRAFVPKVPKFASYPPHCEPRKISFDDHMWLVIKGISHKVGQGGGSAEERGKEHSM
jgi:hypothetical protein